MKTLTIEGKTVSVFPGRTADAPAVYLHTYAEEGPQVLAALQAKQLPDFSLVVISGLDWNHDMVPWDHPPVFKNTPPCTAGADEYLALLTGVLLPAAEAELPGVPAWRGLAGYSLAGLFTLYALYHTGLFSRAASVSGSLWFPGIQEYIFSHEPVRTPDCLYFSLGDKEAKTRNALLQTVQKNTEAIQVHFQRQGIRTRFIQNPGNHYNHAAARTAAGIAWLLTQ